MYKKIYNIIYFAFLLLFFFQLDGFDFLPAL